METDLKRPKTGAELIPHSAVSSDADKARLHAQTAASYIPFLDTEHLLQPKMLNREEMEGVLLKLRKEALVQEYFGDGQS